MCVCVCPLNESLGFSAISCLAPVSLCRGNPSSAAPALKRVHCATALEPGFRISSLFYFSSYAPSVSSVLSFFQTPPTSMRASFEIRKQWSRGRGSRFNGPSLPFLCVAFQIPLDYGKAIFHFFFLLVVFARVPSSSSPFFCPRRDVICRLQTVCRAGNPDVNVVDDKDTYRAT